MVDITVTQVFESLTAATTAVSVTVDTALNIVLGQGEFTAGQMPTPTPDFKGDIHINIVGAAVQFLNSDNKIALFRSLRVQLLNEAGLFSNGPDGSLVILQNNFFDPNYPGTYSYSVTSSAVDITFFAKPNSKHPYCGLRPNGGTTFGRFFISRALA
jgi:hypothetical protein